MRAHLATIVVLSMLLLGGARGQQQMEIIVQPVQPVQPEPVPNNEQFLQPTNYPFYVQSPFGPAQMEPAANNAAGNEQQQRSQVAGQPRKLLEKARSGARKMQTAEQVANLSGQFVNNNIAPPKPELPQTSSCLYEKRYLAKLDECLTRKPYPSIGLPAFKNEDLLVAKRPLAADKRGCLFVLNNGLFKNYQLSRFQLDTDSECLDNTRVGLSLSLSNVSMSYLWTLRCLNQADQLLEDSAAAALSGASGEPGAEDRKEPAVCVGSSQNFGFAALQLGGLDAQVELASDIYKNWRITNITIAMAAQTAGSNPGNQSEDQVVILGDNIRDYLFESLDGDELNWRYLHLFQNWSRNKMHANFLDQFRRFLWVSTQRCLGEMSERLPVKLNDIFNSERGQ